MAAVDFPRYPHINPMVQIMFVLKDILHHDKTVTVFVVHIGEDPRIYL